MRKKTTEEFIEQAKKIHGDLYDYSEVKYITNNTEVKIICKEHGIFNQQPVCHINMSHGCPICKGLLCGERKRFTSELLIEKLNKKYKYRYEYPNIKEEYKNFYSTISVHCKLHDISYKLRLASHFQTSSRGCPKCLKKSYGESIIEYILQEENILFKNQHKFIGCKLKKSLKFDFYLPDYNTVIEFDGKQHSQKNSIYGKREGFDVIKQRDAIKNNYCFDNNIKMIRISYKNQNKIKDILYSKFKEFDIL